MIFPSTFLHCCRACCTREFSRKFCLITISFYYQIGEDGWYWRKIESRIKKDVQVFLFSPHFLVINDNFAFVFNMILSDMVFFFAPFGFWNKIKATGLHPRTITARISTIIKREWTCAENYVQFEWTANSEERAQIPFCQKKIHSRWVDIIFWWIGF